MFKHLNMIQPDAILSVVQAFKADMRQNKMDLGAGVYLDEQGHSPIMEAVRLSEQKILEEETSKAYVGIRGDLNFCAHISKFVLGDTLGVDQRVGAIQTTGGSGALRILADLAKSSQPDSCVWVSNPTWANHIPILHAAGLKHCPYPYFDVATRKIKFDAMLETLNQKAKKGDLLLLHASCHNPTGANLTFEQWKAITDLVIKKGLFPFVDNAYQGFGDGVIADVKGLRHMASLVPDMLIAGSCSKNFGLYKERIGYAIIMTPNKQQTDVAILHAQAIVRVLYSMPPNFGAAIVLHILSDSTLRKLWENELNAMRTRMLLLRKTLADRLRLLSNSDQFDFVEHHRGMFSQMHIGSKAVEALARDHAIYMVGEGRINIAGIASSKIDHLAKSIIASI